MRDEIVTFLKKLADEMQNKTLTLDEERLISEFYLTFQYLQTPTPADETLKYLAMGWYIYSQKTKKEKQH